MSDENEHDPPATTPEHSAEPLSTIASMPRKPVEEWAKERGHVGHERWKFAATKTFKSWPEGAELTGDEYDAAVHEASNLSFGYSHTVKS